MSNSIFSDNYRAPKVRDPFAYSYINILKAEARYLAKKSGVKHTKALQQVAQQAGFNNYHELTKVAEQNPEDKRLMKAALGTDDFFQVVFQDDVVPIIDHVVEEALSADIAETNATDFEITNLVVHDADFERSNGVLFVEILFDYFGDYKHGEASNGSVFHVNATLMLARRNGEWNISEPFHGLELHEVERDVDRARHQEEVEYRLHQQDERDYALWQGGQNNG